MGTAQPVFLTIEQVLEMHAGQIERYGGSAGIRDLGLLDSALAMPSSAFAGQRLHQSYAEMAGAYLFHLVKNHPFVDGNKRIASMAAFVFLDVNGVEFKAQEDEFCQLTLACAAGEIGKDEVIAFFRKHVVEPGVQ